MRRVGAELERRIVRGSRLRRQGCKRDLGVRDRDETETFDFQSETRPRPRPSHTLPRPRRDRDLEVLGPRRDRDRDVETETTTLSEGAEDGGVWRGGVPMGEESEEKIRFWFSNRRILVQTGCFLYSSPKAGLNAVP